MPTTLFLNGRVTANPGHYTEIDASGLETVGLGANGIVAIIGTAVGGKPVSEITDPADFLRFTKPEKIRETFISGDLREAGSMIFDPSNDSQVLGGAQEVVAMKVNPATQSSATLVRDINSQSVVVGTLTSEDYGAFTSQIHHSIANGTGTAKNLTVELEDQIDSETDVGGDVMFQLRYSAPTSPTQGWETAAAQVRNTGIVVNATWSNAGLDGDREQDTIGGTTLDYTSGDAENVGKTVTVYGLDVSDNPQYETKILETGTVAGTKTWSKILGATISEAAEVAVVTIDETPAAGSPIFTFAVAGSVDKGLIRMSAMFVGNTTVVVTPSAAVATEALLVGLSPVGLFQMEKIDFNSSANPIRTTNSWSRIDAIALGDVAAGTTVTVSATAAQTVNTTQSTLQKAADYFNARQTVISGTTYGFVWTMVTGSTSKLVADMDLTIASGDGTNIMIAVPGADFYANLDALSDYWNDTSGLVNFEKTDFVAKVIEVTITAASPGSDNFDYTIDGTLVQYAATGAYSAQSVRDGSIALINSTQAVNTRVVADTNATDDANKFIITALTPRGFTLSVTASGGASLSQSTLTSTSGGGVVPDNVTDQFLTGGSEGTTTFNDWQDALNLLKKIRVNSVVVMTGDPAVHAALEAHCAFMCGLGKSERDGFVGLLNDDLDDLPSKTEIKSQIVDLNSRHIRAFGQSITRFNTAGDEEVFLPPFQAVIAAGMQAGSSVGTSLTHKFAKVNEFSQATSWNPVDDVEEMILGGLCFMERVDGVGNRFVRNITTWLKDNNLAFSEASVNNAANFATFNFRTNLEFVVGRKGFAGTIAAAKGAAVNTLGLLVDAGVLVRWQALAMELNADILEVSVEIAPVIPINFVKSTIHLVTVRQIAG